MGSACAKEDEKVLEEGVEEQRDISRQGRLMTRRNALRKQESTISITVSKGYVDYPDPSTIMSTVRTNMNLAPFRLRKQTTKQSLFGNLQISMIASISDVDGTKLQVDDANRGEITPESFEDFEKRIKAGGDDAKVQTGQTTLSDDNGYQNSGYQSGSTEVIMENGVVVQKQESVDEGVSLNDADETSSTNKRAMLNRVEGSNQGQFTSIDEGISSPIPPETASTPVAE